MQKSPETEEIQNRKPEIQEEQQKQTPPTPPKTQEKKKTGLDHFVMSTSLVLLSIIPIIVCIYSIYYLVQVATNIFIHVIGASNTVIAALLALSSLVSAATAIIGLKGYQQTNTSSLFHIYIISTLLGFILCSTVLIYTSVSSQSTYENHISLFLSLYPNDPDSISFTNSYMTTFSRMKYFFNVGESSNEVYIILTALWVICFIGYFIIVEFYKKEKEKEKNNTKQEPQTQEPKPDQLETNQSDADKIHRD